MAASFLSSLGEHEPFYEFRIHCTDGQLDPSPAVLLWTVLWALFVLRLVTHRVRHHSPLRDGYHYLSTIKYEADESIVLVLFVLVCGVLFEKCGNV
jgi:hypothetical protein